MRWLMLKYKKRTLRSAIVCHCSTSSTKYVNKAKSGKSNFEQDFNESHIETSIFQKVLLGLGSGFMSITDPRRGDMVAVMGESTGIFAFEYIRRKMLQSDEGKEILEEKPRISSAAVDLEKLKLLPEGTLGHAYSEFLDRYKYTPDARLAVRFVDDLELAYVAQRYREAHDLFHTILDMPTNMLGEVTVKWVEAIQTRLPMCITGALFGPLRLAPKCMCRMYMTTVNMSSELKGKSEQDSEMRGKYMVLPDTLEKRIVSILKQELGHNSSKDIGKYKKMLFRRELPYEGLKRESMIAAFMNHTMKKLMLDNQSEQNKKDIDVILNKKIGKYTKMIDNIPKGPIKGEKKCLQYLQVRASFEYSSVLRTLKEVMKHEPDFKPKNLFDFGSGIGTVTWAASKLWKDSLKEYFTVDLSKEMNDLAYKIIKLPNSNETCVNTFHQRQFLPSADVEFDVVVSAFSFLYLDNYAARMETLSNLWNKAGKYLILIENGTKGGFQVITEARHFLIEQAATRKFKCHVVAPCPHSHACPLALSHRTCRLNSYFKDLKLKKNEMFESTPYSYIIFQKGKEEKYINYPRIINDVVIRQRHITTEVCSPEGKSMRIVITKNKNGTKAYALAKTLKLGDQFPGTISFNGTGHSVSINKPQCEENNVEAQK